VLPNVVGIQPMTFRMLPARFVGQAMDIVLAGDALAEAVLIVVGALKLHEHRATSLEDLVQFSEYELFQPDREPSEFFCKLLELDLKPSQVRAVIERQYAKYPGGHRESWRAIDDDADSDDESRRVWYVTLHGHRFMRISDHVQLDLT